MPKKERDGKVNISIWINKDTHARLVELAKNAEFTVSDIVRIALKEYISKKKN